MINSESVSHKNVTGTLISILWKTKPSLMRKVQKMNLKFWLEKTRADKAPTVPEIRSAKRTFFQEPFDLVLLAPLLKYTMGNKRFRVF